MGRQLRDFACSEKGKDAFSFDGDSVDAILLFYKGNVCKGLNISVMQVAYTVGMPCVLEVLS